VPTIKKPCLTPEIFRLDIKYHMTANILVGRGDCFFSIKNLECNSNIIHILTHRILPESVVIFLVKFHTVVPALWNFNSKLVGLIVITHGHSGNNSGALLKDIWGPPDKSRGIKQAFGSSILSNLNRVDFFEICQALPACSTIFPLNTKVPTFSCFPQFLVAVMLDINFSRSNGMAISYVVNNALHKIVLSAFNVTLGIHIFCNHIGSVFITAAIWKLNFISSCVYYWVGIGSPPHSAIQIMIAP
jgi:hypothetical protein